MKPQNKKGFTIVELVIVIAVIAILAAILVPVISNLVKRAHVTKDSQLVRNLNTALAVDTSTPKHETMQSALDAAAKNGYNVGKINASATDNLILWDSVNDVFCYVVEAEDGTQTIEYIPESVKGTPLTIGDYRLWIISDTVSDTYSTYYTGNATTINTSKGFDAGSNETIETINYTNTGAAQNVVIRTNSANTDLTINAPADTVSHYGSVGHTNIIAVADASYHENGIVAFMEIATGRIALEKGAAVVQIHLTATAGNFINIIVAKDETVAMPAFSRDSVDIPSAGKLVVALQSSTETTAAKDYVWLTAVGVYEQVTVSASAENAGTNYAATNGTEERKTTAQQIANNVTTNVGGEEYTLKATKTGDTWTYSLEGETAEATAAVATYTVTATTETVTVMDGSDPVESTTTIDNGLSEGAKNDVKNEIVEIAQNEEILDKAEDAGYEIIHHDAAEATCTEIGHTAYDSYYVNAEEVKVGYKEFAALGHNGSLETGLCTVCGERVYRAKIGDVGYESLPNAWNVGVGKTIVLLDDSTLNAFIINSIYVLDLNGYTLTLRGHSQAENAGLFINGDASLGRNGNLTIRNGSLNFTGSNVSNYGIYCYGTLTMENVVVTSVCNETIHIEAHSYGNNNTISLNNVTINATKTALQVNAYKSYWSDPVIPTINITNSNISSSTSNALSLNGAIGVVSNSTFSSTSNKGIFVYSNGTASGVVPNLTLSGTVTSNASSAYNKFATSGTVNVSIGAGTYTFNPSSYVDTDNFDVSENDGVYTVTAK